MSFLSRIASFFSSPGSSESSDSSVVPPAAASAQEENDVVEAVLGRLERRDPGVLVLQDVGDGHIDASEVSRVPGLIEVETVGTLSGPREFPRFMHDTVVVWGWDKNAVYYNLDGSMFPKMKNIVMLSHPCEYSVPWREKDWTWILPHPNPRYFGGHQNCKEMTEIQVTRLYAALEKFSPVYSAKSAGGGRNLLLYRKK
jgi:hypothetical protein